MSSARIGRARFLFERTIRNRLSVILPYVKGRDVLDVGCVDSRPSRDTAEERVLKPNLLHKRLAAAEGAHVLGVDVDREGIEALSRLGLSAICADAETMDLGRTFDTIIAGEVIEHVENPGRFLRNLRRHLRPDGVLIVTTPNPFSAAQAWRIWRHGRPRVHEDHLGWQDPATLSALLRRTGFEPFAGYWFQPKHRLVKAWKRILRPYFSTHIVVLARRAGP